MRTRPKKGEPGYAEYRARENERQAKRRASWASHGKRYRALWRAEHRDAVRASQKRWRALHPDANAACAARFKERHPNYWREHYRTRRKPMKYLRDLGEMIREYRERTRGEGAAEA